MSDQHRRVMTSKGDPLGSVVKTKRDRKRITNLYDPMMPLGMSSFISPPGHRVAYYIAPPDVTADKQEDKPASKGRNARIRAYKRAKKAQAN